MRVDSTVLERFWEAEQEIYEHKGFEGWMLIGTLAVMNFMYSTNKFNEIYSKNEYYEGQFFSSLAWRTWYGAAQWLKIFINMAGWTFVLAFWFLTLIPNFYYADQLLFYSVYTMTAIQLIRLFGVTALMLLGLAIDKYEDEYSFYDYFEYVNAFGEMALPKKPNSTVYFQEMEYALEFVTIGGCFAFIPLFSQRFYESFQKLSDQRKSKYLITEKSKQIDQMSDSAAETIAEAFIDAATDTGDDLIINDENPLEFETQGEVSEEVIEEDMEFGDETEEPEEEFMM